MNIKFILIPSFFAIAVVIGIALMIPSEEANIEEVDTELETVLKELEDFKAQKIIEEKAELSKLAQTVTVSSLAQRSGELTATVDKGTSQMVTWTVGMLANDELVTIELYSTGQGSRFVSMPNEITVQNELVNVNIFLEIPESALPGEYEIKLHAKKASNTSDTVNIALEAVKLLKLKVI